MLHYEQFKHEAHSTEINNTSTTYVRSARFDLDICGYPEFPDSGPHYPVIDSGPPGSGWSNIQAAMKERSQPFFCHLTSLHGIGVLLAVAKV